MKQTQQLDFIRFAITHKVLRFGDFTLKSGRKSPYFFNAGLFNHGATLAALGEFYAQTIINTGADIDMLFGPAYKGIPLVSSTAIALAQQHSTDLPYCFDRKEAKDHGEGGQLVGAALKGKVMILDDVITAGTAIRGALQLIRAQGAEVAGIVIALDRQERGQSELSAIQELEQQENIPVYSIANLETMMNYLAQDPELGQHLDAVRAYRQQYGI